MTSSRLLGSYIEDLQPWDSCTRKDFDSRIRPQLARGGLVHYSKIGVPEMSTIARSCSSVVSLSFIVVDERVNCRLFSESSQKLLPHT